jgi:hypothetical protein
MEAAVGVLCRNERAQKRRSLIAEIDFIVAGGWHILPTEHTAWRDHATIQ